MGLIINLAIIEDDVDSAKTLTTYVDNYKTNHEAYINYTVFYTAKSFLKSNFKSFNLVFMDIELPDGNGLDLAGNFRKENNTAILVLITNMAKYAIKGYEVQAFDFIVKPLDEYIFNLKMDKLVEKLDSTNESVPIWIKTGDGKVCVSSRDIYYIEVMKHYLIFHTKSGDYTSRGTMSTILQTLKDMPFCLCNRCYLVNLFYVKSIGQFEVVVAKDTLQISRLKRKEFMDQLNNFLAYGKIKSQLKQ